MIKLVAIDVDGTLVGSKDTIADRVWPAMEHARAAGLHLALCSGRPAFGGTKKLAERVSAKAFHLFQNGASIFNPATGESRARPLPDAVVAKLRAQAAKSDDVLELYTETDYAVEKDTELARQHAKLLDIPFRAHSFDDLKGPIVRAQWLVKRDRAQALLAGEHEGYQILPSTTPSMPDVSFMNMTATGVDKASSLAILAEIYGVTLADTMFVGDGANDVEAMRVVGFPVAMGNAVDEVIALAKKKVASVDDGGVADALALAQSG